MSQRGTAAETYYSLEGVSWHCTLELGLQAPKEDDMRSILLAAEALQFLCRVICVHVHLGRAEHASQNSVSPVR